jgi:adenylate cyclase
VTLNYLSWTLFALGYPDQADARAQEALAEARCSSALTMALVLDNSLCLDQLRRDSRAVEEHADALRRVAEETENAFFMERANLFRGWMLVSQGRCADGIALLRRAAEATWKAGSEIEAPLQLALLADAYRMVGEVDAGLRCVDDALARVQHTGERWYEADLYRLKGDLIADRASSAAEACHRRALKIARNQSARAWELRAATRLARSWLHRGRRAEARGLLASVYGWFSEGFNTPDLREAKARLDELR